MKKNVQQHVDLELEEQEDNREEYKGMEVAIHGRKDKEKDKDKQKIPAFGKHTENLEQNSSMEHEG